MKLSELEDADRLVTKDHLEIAIGRLQNRMDERFNAVDARINRVERSIWLLLVAALIQVVAVFGPLIIKVVFKQS